MAASFPFGALCVLVLIGPLLAPANAKVVSYNFSGTVDYIFYEPLSSIDIPNLGKVSVGDNVTGTLTYETQSPLKQLSGDGHQKLFRYETLAEAPLLTYHIGNIEQPILAQGRDIYIRQIVDNLNYPNGWISIKFYGGNYHDPRLAGDQINFFTFSAANQALTPNPLESINLLDFDPEILGVAFYLHDGSGSEVGVGMKINSITPAVPEPNALLSLGAGLFIVVIGRSRGNQQKKQLSLHTPCWMPVIRSR